MGANEGELPVDGIVTEGLLGLTTEGLLGLPTEGLPGPPTEGLPGYPYDIDMDIDISAKRVSRSNSENLDEIESA